MTLDTVRADHVGSYGAERAHTPNLDTIAKEGVRFETAISPTPLTLPSHASLMTSLDPSTHGVRHNGLYRLGGGIPTLAEQLRAEGYRTAAVVGALVLDRRFGLARGFDVYDDAMGGRTSGTVGYAERSADQVAEAALAWLATAPDRFFLWLHFYDPHARYAPPSGFASAFASRPYQGEIAFVDAQLGRVFEEVERRWPDGRTLVVVTSDHGESLGEHGEATHSYTVYDATQRVPLLLSGPGLPAGRVISETARLVDVAPTLLALAGAPPLPAAEGSDLTGLIAGDEEGRIAFVETQATRLDHGWSPLFGVRTQNFKYIRAPRPELYDLVADPRETRDIASERPEVVAKLDALLTEKLQLRRDDPDDAPREVSLDSVDRERLRSLGYMLPAGGGAAGDPNAVVGPDPKDEIGLLRVLAAAQEDIDAGRLEAAIAKLDRAANDGMALRSLRASVTVASGDFERAESDARAVLAQQPERADVWMILGRALAAQGRLEPARAAFEAALEREPGAAVASTFLGRIHESLGDVEGASAHYERARETNADALEATWRLAVLRLRAPEPAAADPLLAELARERDLPPAAEAELARAEAHAGRRDAARRRLAAARARHPESPELSRAAREFEAPDVEESAPNSSVSRVEAGREPD